MHLVEKKVAKQATLCGEWDEMPIYNFSTLVN